MIYYQWIFDLHTYFMYLYSWDCMRISQVKELQAEMTEAWSSYSPLELTGSSRNFPCYNRSMVRTEGGTLPCQTEPPNYRKSRGIYRWIC